MTVRLRPHHLLCLLTYVGKGYTQAFVDNYDRIARRLSKGEGIVVVDGPDDVCAALLCEPDAHCFRGSVRTRDARAATDLSNLLNTIISDGVRMQMNSEQLVDMRKAFVAGVVRSACHGCEWFELCSTIAGDNYGKARLQQPVS